MSRRTLVPRLARASAAVVAALAAAFAAGADTKPAPAAGGLATVVVAAQTAPNERMLDGTVEAVNQSTVSAQTAGRVEAIFYDVNDTVPAAQAALKEATAREAEAQARFERIGDMYQRRVVAKATYDEASAARDAAVARLIAARAGLDAAREGVAYTEIRAPYSGVVTHKHPAS